jgi:hypothetical protein
VGYRWSRRFNRSEILKSPAKKSGNIIFVFGFRCKQIVARDHRASERCHTLIMRLPRFSPGSNPISTFGVFSDMGGRPIEHAVHPASIGRFE